MDSPKCTAKRSATFIVTAGAYELPERMQSLLSPLKGRPGCELTLKSALN